MASVSDQSQTSANFFERMLNYDFCPWANRWVYWLKHPLVGLTVAGLAAGICAFYVAAQAWLLCAGMFLIAGIGLLWPLISMHTLRAEIRMGRGRCEEGQSVCVEVFIHNRLALPNWGVSVTSVDPNEPALASFVRVPAWKTTSFRWEFEPSKRGIYPNSPLYLESGFPFGVWKARRLISLAGEIVVTPRPVGLDATPDLKSQLAFDDQFSATHAGDAGDIMGTRAYRLGDSLRRIHWGLTARSGQLICTERQATVQSTKSIFVDLSRDHHAGLGAGSSYEWAIRLLAGVCQEFSQQGMSVQIRFGSDEMTVSPGRQSLQRLLTRLARLPDLQDQSNHSTGVTMKSDIAIVTDRSSSVSAAIVLKLVSSGFEGSVDDQTAAVAATAANRQVLPLTSASHIETELKASWRRICHAVS